MLFVKKCQFFLYLVLVKTRLEIRFYVLDSKETFSEYKNKFFQSAKNVIFQRGLPMLSVQKCQIFLYLDLVKIRVEKILNNFVEKEETFF